MRIIFKDVISKLRSSYWLKSGTLVLMTRVSIMIFGFIGFLILVRYLNKEQFGVWVIYMTVASLIETVRIGFLKSPLMILNSDKTVDKRLVYSASFFLNLAVTMLFATILIMTVSVFGVFYDVTLIKQLFSLFIVKLVIISTADHFDLVQETNLEFKGSFQDLLSRNLVFVLLLIISVAFGFHVELNTLVIFQIVGCVMGVSFTVINAYKKGINVLPSLRISSKYLKRYFELGKFTFGTSLLSITARNIDTWMLGVLISPAAVAIYNPALRLSNIFEIPSSTLSTILLPKLTKKIGSGGADLVRHYYEKSLSYMLIFMIPVIIFFFIFSDEIINIIAGEGFEESGNLLRITIFYGFFIPFNRQFTVIMESVGRPKISFVVIVCTLVLNLLLNYFFISMNGVFGAAFGSLTTYILIFMITQIYLGNNFQIRIWNVFLHFASIMKKAIKGCEVSS